MLDLNGRAIGLEFKQRLLCQMFRKAHLQMFRETHLSSDGH